MKKYITFAISFLVLFSVFYALTNVLSGLFLTFAHTADLDEAWHMSAHMSQKTAFGGSGVSFWFILFSAFLAASIAYVIPEKWLKK